MISVIDLGVSGPISGPDADAEVRRRARVLAELRAGARRPVPQGGVTTGPAMSLGEREWMRGASSETARRLFELGRGDR